ncbi:transient receptor potential channel pyrexia [Agrilus planipennis]|uniref:Transient receptor potential channel pyrexia n=1 Tax=Agrilus planipennis TaxID=224129 RepID=A0A1W4WPQ0_AGRPL|nr:transient receptor potential channel pyrexia [Agrilus planipennis]
MAFKVEYPAKMKENFLDVDSIVDIDISSEEEEEPCGSECTSSARNRSLSVQDIWNNEDVINDLEPFQKIEEIEELIDQENVEFLSKLTTKSAKTALLMSAWLGNEKCLKFLLDHHRVPVNCTDNNGRTPLHLASCSGSVECVKRLLDAGAKVTIWDNAHKATPLHCAASRGHLSVLRMLIRHGANVDAGQNIKSPLYYAVRSLAVECVRELLEVGANPNTLQVFTETPLHVAASLGSYEIIKLLIDHGAAVNVQCGSQKTTALHLVAEDGNPELARLLLDAGAHISATNRKLQTPLHLAALSQCVEIVELLLSRGADPNASDANGRTPLHGAIVKISDSCDCVKVLLNAGANVNKPDIFGYTPLHLAALNEYSACVILFLNHGGDVTLRTKGGVSVLTFITRRTPDVIPKYIEKFDSSIKVNDHEIGDVDCELKLDFRVLVPTMGRGETDLLLNFIEVGHREVLQHPLCETFLHLKWKRIRKFFFLGLFYNALSVFLYTAYVIGVFLRDCPFTKDPFSECEVYILTKVCGYVLLFLNVVTMFKEIFQLSHGRIVYVKEWENWLQWATVIAIYLSVSPTNQMNIRKIVTTWQHHVAAIGIFFAWFELMMIVGRFPMFGLYVQMFTTVTINFSKFFFAYSCLLIAFGLSFGVLFANYPSFMNTYWGLLKTIIMMTGELEFEDIFYATTDYPILYPITSHLMFLAFVILVTLVLSNLMVGLAVSDIQGLQKSAGLDRLVRQAELVAHLESLLFSRLLQCLPNKVLAFLYGHALLLKSQYHWALYIRPNDPREERIPKDLVRNIYQLVIEKRDKPKIGKKQVDLDHWKNKFTTRTDGNSSYISRNNKKQSYKRQMQQLLKETQEFCKYLQQRLDVLEDT